MADPPHLILYSGLAATDEVFVPQRLAFPELIVPPWLIPEDRESLDSYCQRLAATLPPDGPIVLGGASFGGIIAQHVAQFRSVDAIVLIGSLRSPDELPTWIRLLSPLRFLLPVVPITFCQMCMGPLEWTLMRNKFPVLSSLARQFRRADRRVLRWSLRTTLEWKTRPSLACPVYRIHGDNDRILSVHSSVVDVRLPYAGHVLTLSHPREVNTFLKAVLNGELNRPTVNSYHHASYLF